MTRRREATVALLVTAYSVVLGGALGLVWPRLAPHVQIVQAINGSEAATKALLGDDMWFALLGVVTGLVSLAVLLLVARDVGLGPGAVVGLAVGGVLGSIVAARVGHQVQSPHIVATLNGVHLTHAQVTLVLGYFDFEVRARAVLLAWSFAAVVVLAATGFARRGREEQRKYAVPS